MLDFIKRNKWTILILTILFGILVYCCFQTFIINDDLAYSFFLRTENRVTNLRGIIVNQIFDYSNINPRIIIHSIVQFLLIFDKNLWAFVNPAMIILTILLMTYFVCHLLDNKGNEFLIMIFSAAFYLLLYNYKVLIYWVAGSVNYVFVFVIMLLFIIYYFKKSLTKKTWLSMIICLIASLLHESLGIFVLMVILGDFIYNLITNKEKDKIFYLKYAGLIVCSILGLLFILLAPSTFGRFSSEGVWATYSLIEKLSISIPVISNNLFGLFNVYNIFPTLLIGSMIFVLYKTKDKLAVPFTIISIVLGVMAALFNWLWLTFILGVLILCIQFYIFYKNKNYKMLVILVAIYAVSYSMIITSEYASGRPNYHFCLISSVIILFNIFKYVKYDAKVIKPVKIASVIMLATLVFIELNIYTYIGQVKNERDIAIKIAKEKGNTIIKLKEIKEPYAKFHIDPNSPSDINYWAYKSFLDYYNLKDDVRVKIIK